jgi:hypothetical protein
VADLDKDGKMDLVVANRDQENQIFLAEVRVRVRVRAS